MRESGYYWVKLDGEWIIAKWSNDNNWWWLCGNETPYSDTSFEEIDERIERTKPK